MTTFTSLEEDALTILSFFKRRSRPDGGVLHYSGLCDDARGAGMNLHEFRDALEWLTDNHYLDVVRGATDSYRITHAGYVRVV